MESSTTHIGVIAQEVVQVAPYCVGTSTIVVDQTDAGAFGDDVVQMINDSTPQAIVKVMNYNYDGLIYAMINAIKELDSTVTAMQAQSPQNQFRIGSQDSLPSQNVQQVTLSNPSRAILYQNIPNPANEKTVINYFVPESAVSAEMIFYNEFGVELKRVPLENKGNAALDVNTFDLNAGIYSYSLVIDGHVIDTKQMIRTR